MSHPVAMHCPGCGCSLRVEVASPPAAERERWRTLRDVARATGQPLARLRRMVRDGRLEAKAGPRGAYLIRVADVDALADALPRVEPRRADGDDEYRRLMGWR